MHERVFDIGADRRIGVFVDELVAKIWPDDTQATREYELTVEVARVGSRLIGVAKIASNVGAHTRPSSGE